MLKTIITSVLLFACMAASAQEKEPPREEIDRLTDSVMAEGKALFRSEWASWHGTDVFQEKVKDKHKLSAGYISYETPSNLVNVFYSKGENPVTVAVITFGKDFNVQNYQLDTVARPLNKTELDLFTMRRAALKTINTDTLFKTYQNTSLNVVPFINNGVKRIYILTAPEVLNVIALGNDYLLSVNDKNEVTSVKRIHNTLIWSDLKSKDVKSIFHSHLPDKDQSISATDICTLMLYEKENNLKQSYVISRKYVSIWDCGKDELVILTRQAWDRINEDQKKRHPKQ